MKTLEISTKLGNVTKSYLLEPLNLQAIHDKIEKTCLLNGVEFVPSLITIENSYIRRGVLLFSVKHKSIANHFKLDYDKDREYFRRVWDSYNESAEFLLDAEKWVDTDDLLCLPMFYTYGEPMITSLSRKDFCKISCEIQTSLSPFLQGGNYEKHIEDLKAITDKNNYALDLIEIYSN